MVLIQTINDLPDVALIRVFSFCSQAELWKIRAVCWQWYHLLSDVNLWKVSDLSNFACKEVIPLMDAMGYLPTSCIRFFESRKNVISVDVLSLLLGLAGRLQGMQFVNCRFTQSLDRVQEVLPIPIVGDLKVLDLRRSVGHVEFVKECLRKQKGIEILALPNCVFAEHAIEFQWTFANIKVLELADCQWVNDQRVSEISDLSPHLESLNLYKCINVRGYTLHKLASKCKRLRSLVLRRTSVRDEAVSSSPWRCENLSELDISHCYYLDEAGTLNILDYVLPKLTYLCVAVTDKVLEHACSFKRLRLKALELRRRYPVNVDRMVEMMCLCPDIEILDISLTPLDSKTMNRLLPNMPKLRWVSFAAHEVLRTTDTMQLLSLYCGNIETVGINYYHATNDCLIKSALLTMMIVCKRLKTICLQGLWVVPVIRSIEHTVATEQMFQNVKAKFCHPSDFKFPMAAMSLGKYVSRMKEEMLHLN